MMTDKERIARRAAMELRSGDVVNLGIGLPTMVSNFLPKDVEIMLHSENGILGMGELCQSGTEDIDCINSGNQYVTIQPGACFFDSCTSFGIIRGGHIDVTILGALQIDETGTLASHIVPGSMVPGMGGAMDLVAGAKKVIVTTTHTVKGNPKLLKKVLLPPTAIHKVNLIITELAVIEVTKQGFLLKEMAEYTTVDDIQRVTDAPLMLDKNLKRIQFDMQQVV